MQNKYLLVTLLFLLALLPSCEKNDPSVNAGRLRVKLTDATDITIRELYLDIREISVYATDTASMEGEWVTLDYTGGEYNLLKWMNGKSLEIVNQYFPAGKTIQSARLVFGNNSRIHTVTDAIYSLHYPPEIIDGVEIDLVEPIVIMPNVISGLVIDVNAALSIWEADGNYFLHPVARAFSETYGSSLRGYVAPTIATASVVVIQDPDTLITILEEDGMFLFPGLQEGPWEIYLFAKPGTIYKDTAFIWNIEAPGMIDITPKPLQLPRQAAAPN